MEAFNTFITNIYPYIAVTIFLLGSWLRYDHGAYTWRAASSQMLSPRGMWFASNVFHIGIIFLILAHIVGVVAFGSVSDWPLTVSFVCGFLILIGGGYLVLRRLGNVRVRITSNRSDTLVIALLVLMAILGLVMTEMKDMAPYVIEHYPDAMEPYLKGTVDIAILHRALGWTILAIFPFTRLVHIWSIPLGYLFRRYQLVRARR
ncbi:MAG: respiratory nitrate reductase subunit gamma [Betaproteobacteria bacterium]|nr:respiratory nitrate reductase subunit gamma [Betaproteobacteria bacterium]